MWGKAGFILTVAGLAGILLGCREKPKPVEKILPQAPVIEEVIEEAPKPEIIIEEPEPEPVVEPPKPKLPSDIVGWLIHQYKETGDDTQIRKAARDFESAGICDVKSAVALYLTLDDTISAQRTAVNNFIRTTFFTDDAAKVVQRTGLEVTADLYARRGDYQFEKERYEDALKAYDKSGDIDGVRRSIAKLLEKDKIWSRDDIFEAYSKYDREAAHNMAKKEFITNENYADARWLSELNIKPTLELWKERADHLLSLYREKKRPSYRNRMILESAFEAYGNAELIGSMSKVARLYLAELDNDARENEKYLGMTAEIGRRLAERKKLQEEAKN